MSDEGDRWLTAIGVGLALVLVAGVGVAVLAAANGPSTQAGEPPETDWRFERTNATHVRLVHDGGDPVSASRLVVLVDGYERHTRWPDRVADGDAGVLQVRADSTVRLYWNGGRADRVLLGRWQA